MRTACNPEMPVGWDSVPTFPEASTASTDEEVDEDVHRVTDKTTSKAGSPIGLSAQIAHHECASDC
jgi:hypothetical protein